MDFRNIAAALGMAASFGTATVEAQRIAPSAPSGTATPSAPHVKHDVGRVVRMLTNPGASAAVAHYNGKHFLYDRTNIHDVVELGAPEVARYKRENLRFIEVEAGTDLAKELDHAIASSPKAPTGLVIKPGL